LAVPSGTAYAAVLYVARAHIDRAKHHVDILEHVCKGVRAREIESRTDPEIVDVRISPWLGGHLISAVQVFDLDHDDTD
jgi:hypothetical protein